MKPHVFQAESCRFIWRFGPPFAQVFVRGIAVSIAEFGKNNGVEHGDGVKKGGGGRGMERGRDGCERIGRDG